MSDLEIFAARYGLDIARLRDQETGQVPLAIDTGGRSDFAGRIEMIRLEPYGRFGNTLFCILNALLIARSLEVTFIELPSLNIGQENLPILAGDMAFTAKQQTPARQPALIGNFFIPEGLEKLTGAYETGLVATLVDQYLLPIYAALLDRAGSLGPNVVVLHFRAGDIFTPGGGHAGYVQPPVSYYMNCVEYACRHLGVDHAYLVFEDRSNPAVDLVATELIRRGIPTTQQSASVFQDLVTVLSAHHLVAPNGTFCEAAAILSPVLQTYTSFRRVGTQRHINHWTQTRIGALLLGRGVRVFVVDDPDDSYIAPDTWQRSGQQLDLLRFYPAQKLRRLEKLPPSTRPSSTQRK